MLNRPDVPGIAVGIEPREAHAAQSPPPGRDRGGCRVPVVLFGIPLHVVDVAGTVDWILRRAERREPGQILTSNLDFALQSHQDPEMHRIHLEADLVVADGMPLVWLSRWFGPSLPARVAGSDLLPLLCEAAANRSASVYALGAEPGVAQRALEILKSRFPGLRVAGWDSPPPAPLEEMRSEEILGRIGAASPNLLFVALGTPKQDKWIRNHRGDPRLPLSIGVGASLDFVAGAQTRAPKAVQRIGLEWLWRLALQPRRLFGRYAGDFRFLAWMLLQLLWIRMSPLGRAPAKDRPGRRKGEALGTCWIELPPLRRPEEAEALVDLQLSGNREVVGVVDLWGRTWLNSLELGTLIALSRQRRLVLAGAPLRILRLLRLFRLTRFFCIPRSIFELESELAGPSPTGKHFQ